jgi:hypothetical protein
MIETGKGREREKGIGIGSGTGERGTSSEAAGILRGNRARSWFLLVVVAVGEKRENSRLVIIITVSNR